MLPYENPTTKTYQKTKWKTIKKANKEFVPDEQVPINDTVPGQMFVPGLREGGIIEDPPNKNLKRRIHVLAESPKTDLNIPEEQEEDFYNLIYKKAYNDLGYGEDHLYGLYKNYRNKFDEIVYSDAIS